jgi:hypothetical protein
MKNLYITSYILSLLVLIIVIAGGGISEPIFTNISAKTLTAAGINKSSVDSADTKIDNLIHAVKKFERQIEKVKKFFSSDKIDEEKYKKKKNNILLNTVYNPLIEILNYVYRFCFLLFSFILLLVGIIFNLIYKSMELRRRVKRLEEVVYR